MLSYDYDILSPIEHTNEANGVGSDWRESKEDHYYSPRAESFNKTVYGWPRNRIQPSIRRHGPHGSDPNLTRLGESIKRKTLLYNLICHPYLEKCACYVRIQLEKEEGNTNQVTEANGVWREENRVTYGPFGPRWCILQLDRAGIAQGGRDKGPWSSWLVESYSQHHVARRASISRTSPRSLHSLLIWKTQLRCTQIRWMQKKIRNYKSEKGV